MDSSICVVQTLREYKKRTCHLRKSAQLLVSYKAPHKPVCAQTVSRWIREILTLAGVDIKYTSHSTRSAATSAAAEAGVSLEVILEAADWASARTFEQHYYKRIEGRDFASAVLQA